MNLSFLQRQAVLLTKTKYPQNLGFLYETEESPLTKPNNPPALLPAPTRGKMSETNVHLGLGSQHHLNTLHMSLKHGSDISICIRKSSSTKCKTGRSEVRGHGPQAGIHTTGTWDSDLCLSLPWQSGCFQDHMLCLQSYRKQSHHTPVDRTRKYELHQTAE